MAAQKEAHTQSLHLQMIHNVQVIFGIIYTSTKIGHVCSTPLSCEGVENVFLGQDEHWCRQNHDNEQHI